MALPAAVGGVIRPQNCGPKHHVARPQQGAGDIVRAIDQGCGIGLVGEGGREGVSRLARIGEGLTRASALRDGVRRRGAADLRDGRRLDLDEGIARQSGRLRLSARSDRGRLRLSQRAFCGLGVRCCIRGAHSSGGRSRSASAARRDRLGYRRSAACRRRIGHRRRVASSRRRRRLRRSLPPAPPDAFADDSRAAQSAFRNALGVGAAARPPKTAAAAPLPPTRSPMTSPDLTHQTLPSLLPR